MIYTKAFLQPEDWLLANNNHKDDPVKWTRTDDNYARALDLYLALENAFNYYGGDDREEYNDQYSQVLLSKAQKKDVVLKLATHVSSLDSYLHSDAVAFSGVQNYEAEPGNRPMKMFLAMGYGVLGLQNYDPSTQVVPNVSESYLQQAFRSAGLQESSNSIKYWSYQTHNGKRFWAEGPYYFEFTLNDVIPFWHAIRANNMLNWNGNNISDPFSHAWFLNPLDWLADLTTQNGNLPPLDDGNKRSIRYANLLRWSGTYGDAGIGQKFAWIGDKIDAMDKNLDTHTLLVQLAMPQISKNTGIAPSVVVGNTDANQTGNDAEQQVVLRHSDASGNDHYVLLNGESNNNDGNIIQPDDAILRGEGHEQPDQLQLLYYVNGTSFLMDRGYDKAGPTSNSSWNFYRAHNVMQYSIPYQNGGLASPYLDPAKGRKVSYHQPVKDLYYKTPSNNVVEINATQYLVNGTYKINGIYDRNILYVKGYAPYIIDFNSLKTTIDDYEGYNAAQNSNSVNIQERLFYHGNSTSFNKSSA